MSTKEKKRSAAMKEHLHHARVTTAAKKDVYVNGAKSFAKDTKAYARIAKKHAHSIREEPKSEIKNLTFKGLDFLSDTIIQAGKSMWNTVVSLYRNAEGVLLLTLAGLGATSLIGEITIANAALATILMWEMVPAVLAVAGIWLLLQSAMWRKSHAA